MVTLDDCIEEGLDLENELPQVFPSMNPLMFIKRIEDWCKMYLKFNYEGINDNLSDYQEKHFKKGVIMQMEYLIENGDLSNDTGIRETGILDLSLIKISPNAMYYFKMGGLANLKKV